MKWPSLKSLWDESLAVAIRFPLQVFVTLVALLTSYMLIDYQTHVAQEYLTRLLMVCNLTFVLLLSADLFAEVHVFSALKKWMLRLFCLLLGVVLYFTLRPSMVSADLYRFMLLGFAFHLLVAFVPFINKGNINGFWEYNKILFIRILTAGLYAGVLYTGLAIAVSAVKGLFNVQIDNDIFLYLLTTVGIGFTTLFFLAGVPVNFKKSNEGVHAYPKGLKVFSQYVLIPLLTIYLAILLVYEAKIIVNWEFPKGMVSLLILGYSVFGVLSLLLIHPVKDEEGNGWMKLFARFFYIMMIPLVILLLLAVWERLRNYGITEPRYILVVLAVWLTIITAYFLVSKKDNIKIIPMSLCVLALLATYGPQSAFSVSAYSQKQRLQHLMAVKSSYALKERPAVVRYLVKEHGLTALQGFTKVDMESLEDRITAHADKVNLSRYEVNDRLVDTAFKVLKLKEASAASQIPAFFYAASPLQVSGYDFLLDVDNYMTSSSATVNGVSWEITKSKGQLKVKVAGQELIINTDPLIAEIHHAYLKGDLKAGKNSRRFDLPQQNLSVVRQLPGYELQLLMTELTLDNAGDAVLKEYNFKGYLLIKIK